MDTQPIVIQALHVAAHIDLELNLIIPYLERGNIVLLDRFWLSTLAYGKANGISELTIEKLVSVEQDFLDSNLVDYVFFITRDNEILEQKAKTEEAYRYYINKYFANKNLIIKNNKDLEYVCNLIHSKIKEVLSC